MNTALTMNICDSLSTVNVFRHKGTFIIIYRGLQYVGRERKGGVYNLICQAFDCIDHLRVPKVGRRLPRTRGVVSRTTEPTLLGLTRVATSTRYLICLEYVF